MRSDLQDRRKLLELLLAEEGVAADRPAPIPRVSREAPHPLSFAQQRLWILDRLEPGSPLYTLVGAAEIDGELSVDALSLAVRDLAMRHEALRTRLLADAEGTAYQQIDDVPRLALESFETPGEAAVSAKLRTLALQPFDLERGPLARFWLLRQGPRRATLALSLHHIIADGWSIGVLLRDLAELYGARRAHREPSLPPLELQPVDCASYERLQLGEAALAAELEHWVEALRGAPAALDLPTDRPRPLAQTFAGQTLTFSVPASLDAAVRQLARQHRVTLFSTLLTAYDALLFRLSGQSDVVVGTSVAGRDRPETQAMVGMFVNTLPLRARVAGERSFSELLAQVHEAAIAGLSNQRVPFERIVQAVQPERDLSRSPLFQAAFDFNASFRPVLSLPGATLRLCSPEVGTSKFDLTLVFNDDGGQLEGELELNTDLFDEATGRDLIDQYLRLLEHACAAPHTSVAGLRLLDDEARRHQLVALNQTARAYPDVRPVHVQLAARAAETPEAVAVSCGGRALTYAQLDAASSQIAHALLALQLEPEDRIGVLHERTPETLCALLGILKAGLAYVPLDVTLPPARLQTLVSESGCRCVLTDAARQTLASTLGSAPALVVSELLAAPPASSPALPAVRPSQLAYVLFTSGSTGIPKGAMLEHAGLTNHVLAMAERLKLTAADCMAQTARVSFDVSVWQLLATLTVGGRVAILPDEVVQAPAILASELCRERVTVAELVPAQISLLLEAIAAHPEHAPPLRWMIPTGEALPPPLTRSWFDRLPRVPLLNAYGPTECSDDVTCCELTRPLPPEAVAAPVHGTLPNFQVYVLDARLEPVPFGVTGELYVGGLGVGRGYLADPVRTATAFVPDPFSNRAGARMYRTGDLVRMRRTGAIEFVGRRDHQIKVRGVRIELGDVEAALARLPGVTEAAVVARVHHGDTRLEAFVVVAGPAPRPEDLLRALKSQLPAAAVPGALAVLAALPRLPSGKLDRRALPALAPTIEPAAEPPRGEDEAKVAALFKELLRCREVARDRSFFELGGHSLLAIQLLARVRERLGAEIPLRAFFEAPTVAQLAALIAGARAAPVTALAARPRPERIPLSFAQQRLWFLDQLEPGSATYNMPVAARLTGPLSIPALEKALTALCARHESLRTRFEVVDGEPVQAIDAAKPFVLEVRRDGEVRAALETEANAPFDLARGPLFRCVLLAPGPSFVPAWRASGEELVLGAGPSLTLGGGEHGRPSTSLGANGGEHLLVLGLHHSVSDGWSMGVLLAELSALYGAFERGDTASPLPALPLQYADYALWQREQLSAASLESELSYWSQALAGPLPKLELPTDRPRPAHPSSRGARLPVSLSVDRVTRIRAQCQRYDTTLFGWLLAAFQTLLCRHTGQTDVVIGTPVAGRDRVELEGLIGFFANTLALRGDLSGEPSFEALLAQARRVSREAFSHAAVPFELLVEKLQPERDPSRHPIFQAMLVLQNVPTPAWQHPTLRLEDLPLEFPHAKFDLLLSLEERADGTLEGDLEYATDLFDAATPAQWLRRFDALIDSLLASPEASVWRAELLPPEERELQLRRWNDTGAPELPGGVHALFSQQLAKTPQALAVEAADGSLTYAELEARANRLAHRLRAHGVGRDVRVALCLERGWFLPVAVLGVLKAGGAYVPLDPDYPQDRLAHMLEDAAPPVLVANAALLPRLSTGAAQILTAESLGELQDGPSDAPDDLTQPSDLGYVIYTSGSTGRPKGVALPHRALSNLLAWHARTLIPAARTLQFASLSFDASFHEFFAAWATGGSVVVISELARKDTQALAEFIAEHRIQKAILPVVALQQLAERYEADPAPLSTLREVMATGEQLVITQPLRRLFARLPGCSLNNHYGPSETHVVTALTLEGLPEHWETRPTLGRPIWNSTIYLLDRHGAPVPVGAVGELCIGGANVARGYLNRPEQTAEKFVTDPFSTEPGARLYRTGDLARYRRDGTIEFLGRRDHQVKVRGFRVELGEVENALLAHPAVQETVVVALPGDAGLRLVAYVVTSGEAPTVTELRRFLAARLPDHMVPATYVSLPALPLSPNGKVERRLLPAPEAERPRLEAAYVEPRSAAERVVCATWAGLLGLPRVGLDDNFFELGGHSLLATRVVAALRERFDVELPLRELFDTPTPRGVLDALVKLRDAATVEAVAEVLLELEGLSDDEVQKRMGRT